MTLDVCLPCSDSPVSDDVNPDACSLSHRFTVRHAAAAPRKPSAPSPAPSQADYIPMDYDAELEACSDFVFSESSYHSTVSFAAPSITESQDHSSERDYAPYNYDEALYEGECSGASCATSKRWALEPYSEAWLESQEAQWARHVEGRHYAWCQHMAGESCFTNQEQSQYALKALLREACVRDLAHLRALPAASFAPCGAVETRRMEVNRSASCTSLTSMTAYLEAQQLRARFLDGELDYTASDDEARKASYIASAKAQWQHLAAYVRRELAEDSMRLRSLSNAIQQLGLFRAGPVAPDLEVVFSRLTSARPNTPYSTLFGVARELDLNLVESQNRERRKRAERVLATLASHKTLFIPPTLHATETQAPVPVPAEHACARAAETIGAVGRPSATAASSPYSGPLVHSPLFSLILDPSELEDTQELLLDGETDGTDDDAEACRDGPTLSPWELSLPWVVPPMAADHEVDSPIHEVEMRQTTSADTTHNGIALRAAPLSWTDLSENASYTQSTSARVALDYRASSPPAGFSASTGMSSANSGSLSHTNLYALPSAAVAGKRATLPGLVLTPSVCCGAGGMGVDASPSRFSSFTEGQSSEGEHTCGSEFIQLPSAAVSNSPELLWLAPSVEVGGDAPSAVCGVVPLSVEILQHHEQHVAGSGGWPASRNVSCSGRARTHQEIENICRGWLSDTTTCHFRSSSTESASTEHGAEQLTFYAEMMDDEDRRIDPEEAPLVI